MPQIYAKTDERNARPFFYNSVREADTFTRGIATDITHAAREYLCRDSGNITRLSPYITALIISLRKPGQRFSDGHTDHRVVTRADEAHHLDAYYITFYDMAADYSPNVLSHLAFTCHSIASKT